MASSRALRPSDIHCLGQGLPGFATGYQQQFLFRDHHPRVLSLLSFPAITWKYIRLPTHIFLIAIVLQNPLLLIFSKLHCYGFTCTYSLSDIGAQDAGHVLSGSVRNPATISFPLSSTFPLQRQIFSTDSPLRVSVHCFCHAAMIALEIIIFVLASSISSIQNDFIQFYSNTTLPLTHLQNYGETIVTITRSSQEVVEKVPVNQTSICTIYLFLFCLLIPRPLTLVKKSLWRELLIQVNNLQKHFPEEATTTLNVSNLCTHFCLKQQSQLGSRGQDILPHFSITIPIQVTDFVPSGLSALSCPRF